MLGSEVLSVRLGGIYALQRLAEEWPDQYHIQIMRLFCAFVRLPTSITVAHAVKVPESVSCNDTAWHGPGGAVSSLTIGWSA